MVTEMPRSTSVTVTLAPATTAPLESRTRPTIAPASFCAHSGEAGAKKMSVSNTGNNRTERVCERARRTGMAILLGAELRIFDKADLASRNFGDCDCMLSVYITNHYFYFR